MKQTQKFKLIENNINPGKPDAHRVNLVAEEIYWENNYTSRPYVTDGHEFESYRPAYRAGVEGYTQNPGQDFESLEPSIRNNWNISKGNSKLEWKQAREAARDAFGRLSGRNTEKSKVVL